MTNVLFVCIGNSCRSQMAEGFARKYGSDVMHAWSAGLAPAPIVQTLTVEVMQKKNIDIGNQFPKSVDDLDLDGFDIIVNMSGMPFPQPMRGTVRTWKVDDPIGQPEEVYLRVRDEIEGLMMQFVMELRRAAKGLPLQPAETAAATKTAQQPAVDPNSRRYGFGRIRRARD